jgi:hypothetical protein
MEFTISNRYIQISDMARPICPFLALDISEMDILEMTSSNLSEFRYVHFRYVHFPINHPFYQLPGFFSFSGKFHHEIFLVAKKYIFISTSICERLKCYTQILAHIEKELFWTFFVQQKSFKFPRWVSN